MADSARTQRNAGAPEPSNVAHRVAGRLADMSPFRVVEVMERAWLIESSGRSIVHLVAGEPDFGTPAPVVEAAARAAASGDIHYTPSLGVPALREAISGYYSERFGVDVPPHRIVVTTGASAAILLAFGATVDPGDEVLMGDPGYPCNRNLARLYGGTPVGVPVTPETNWQLTTGLVEAAAGDRTRGVLVGTPSNPTGTIVEPGELAAMVSTCRRRGWSCYVDEVYGELVYQGRPSTILESADDVFVLNSFSKTFGMTGWRLGWLVCPEWALDAVTVLAQNMYISPPTPSQLGAIAAFSPAVWEIVAERLSVLRARRDLIVGGLRRIGFDIPVTPQGAFYVYAGCGRFSSDSTDFVARLLDGPGVAVAPGNDFGDSGAATHVRFSYAASQEQITEALDRLDAYLGG